MKTPRLIWFPYYSQEMQARRSLLTPTEAGALMDLVDLIFGSPGYSVPNDKGWIIGKLKLRYALAPEAYEAVIASQIEEDNFINSKTGEVEARFHIPWLTEIIEKQLPKAERSAEKAAKARAIKAAKSAAESGSNIIGYPASGGSK